MHDEGVHLLEGAHGVLVPGGFGERGLEGKISAIRWARENGVPFFGICLGMQCAVIEYARNALGLEGAHTLEHSPTPHPVISSWRTRTAWSPVGRCARGAYACRLEEGTLARELACRDSERHCHRFEFNNAYREAFESCPCDSRGSTRS